MGKFFGDRVGFVRGKVTNYYRHFIGDYLRKTVHLTMLQDGAYRRLMDEYYVNEKPLTLDRPLLYARVRANTAEEKWAVDSMLSEFFAETPKGFTNKKADEEIRYASSRAKVARNNGLAGGRPKTQLVISGIANECTPSKTPQTLDSRLQTKPKNKTKTHFPEQFEVSARMRSFAIGRGVANPDAEFEAFSDHHTANGSTFSDWEAAWRTWCRKAEEIRERKGNGARQSVAAGGAPRTESFDERRRRQSEAAIGEVSRRARAVVSEVERELPLTRRD